MKYVIWKYNENEKKRKLLINNENDIMKKIWKKIYE